MKNKIIKKGYQVNFNKIDEGYLYSEEVTTADTIGQAKKELLGRLYDAKTWFGDEITYLNIPVIRCEDADIIEFEGKEVSRFKIKEILEKRERFSKLDAILNDENVKFCYIRKGSYYRPGSCGYTDFRYRAGVFTKEEAVQDGKSCSELTIIPIDIVEHNEMITKEINELSSRLLS